MRLKLRRDDRSYSLRGVARQVGIQPSYLSQIERGRVPPPSEHTIYLLAAVLGLDADGLLALAGRVSSELQAMIRRRPGLMGSLVRELDRLGERRLLAVLEEVRTLP